MLGQLARGEDIHMQRSHAHDRQLAPDVTKETEIREAGILWLPVRHGRPAARRLRS